MPLDSYCVAGLARELDSALAAARVDKIHMPARDRVLLHLRSEQGPVRLLLCAGSDARVHLTDTRPENPEAPPMLCMLLRKQLGSGRIVSVRQPGRERVLEITLTAAGELGDITEKRLICEMTGRMTNLILVGEDGIILACLKTVGHEQSVRAVAPGLRYQPPPGQDKPELHSLSDGELEALCRGTPPGMDAADYLLTRVGGVAPLLVRECAFRAAGDTGALARELAALRGLEPRPYMLIRDGGYADFAPMAIAQYGDAESRQWPGFSALLDDYWRSRTHRAAMKNLTSSVQKAAQTAQKRLTRKLHEQRQELLSAQNRQELKNRADLITANLHAIPAGAESALVTDFFDPGLGQIELKLDPRRTPQQAAQALYKKYGRLKNAEAALSAQIAAGEGELEYLGSVLYAISRAETAREAEDLRLELSDAGYLKNRDKGRKKEKAPAFSPRRFDLGDGFVALCGRNNVENDRLTHRHAQKNDLWLHARNIPGAHVVVETGGREAPEGVAAAAAGIAAFYSASAEGGRVAVDCCLVRHVKKPQGARPGMVNYFNYKTLAAVPALPEGEE